MPSLIINIVIFTTLMPVASKAEEFKNFSVQFEQEVVEGDTKEVIRGNIYYQTPEKAVIEINHPLNQIMAIAGKTMTIYYPDEKRAFRFTAKQPIPVPFVESITRTTKEGYGLIELGYTLAKHEKKGERLYVYWYPPAKQKKVLGQFILEIVANKLVCAEAQTPDGKPVVKSVYQRHIPYEEKYIPLEVNSEFYDKSKLIRKEQIIYQEIRFNVKFPDWVLNFKIPDSTHVKEVEW